ncbi:hypothetical protein POTOM_003689 [Populus tomentosa]|uniref:Uncharacterized protein n=1 Tax=Populus tomentosa TaxID=118781 RepID=A0A8X8AIV7_POPTO|nr:hypothetical protein POTOM_003689 [Populus tomentosa]
MRAHDYNQSSLALAPYGSYWRILRRLITVDMSVTKRINETASIRGKCVDGMLLWIDEEGSMLSRDLQANLADFFPWLRRLDLQGQRKQPERDMGKAMEIASMFVKERVEDKKVTSNPRKDFLDVLLKFKGHGKDEPANLLGRDLNIFILESL